MASGIMAKLENMFTAGNKPDPTSQGQGAQQQQNSQGQNPPGFNQSQNQDPMQQQQENGQQAATSPLAEFEDLFTMETDEDGNPAGSGDSDSDEFFSYDPQKLNEGIGKLSFSNIPGFEEQAAAALGGDSAALAALLDGVGKTVLSKAAELSIGVANRASRTAYDRSSSGMDSRVRELLSGNELSNNTPASKNKALQPVIAGIHKQVLSKYPDASPKEVAEMTKNYLKGMVESMTEGSETPTKNPNQEQQARGADFSGFFN